MSNKLVKVILAGEQVFPQTVAESVLVNGTQVLTLDKVLNRKIEQVVTNQDSGLTSEKSGTTVTISHTNKITPNDTPEARLIQYDQNGHIVNTQPFKSQTVIVNGDTFATYDGSKDSVLNLGDDFKIEDNSISLAWGGGINLINN